MLIDWFTVIAQIVNFLILLVLLKYLLYDRVIAAVDRREARIRDTIAEAEKGRQRAEARMQEVREREQELEGRRDAALREAERDADEHRRQLEQTAEEAVEQQRGEWLEGLRRQQESLADGLAEEAWTGAFRLSGLALRRLADQQVSNGLVRAFIRELGELDTAAVEDFTAGLDRSEGRAVVTTAQPLSEEDRERLAQGLRDCAGRDLDVDWRSAEEIGLGIEVKAGGRVLPWKADAWLEGLREDAREAVSRRLENQRGGRDSGPGRDAGSGGGHEA